MAKDLSRREFLKGMTAGAVSVAAASFFAGCGSDDAAAATETPAAAAGTYTPGTYSATAQGIGTVKVTMTFDAESITDIDIDVSGETATIGQAAKDELLQQLTDAQSNEIDGVSGASMTSNAVKEAAGLCIQQAKGEIAVIDTTVAAEEEGTADWLGEEPEVADVDIAETWDTDFLIVGAGNGGLTAGAYAATKGYTNFRIIEKGTEHARVRGWYGAINTEQILSEGGYTDRGDLLRELKKYSSGKCDLSLFNTWYDESAAMHQFIVDTYAEYDPDAVCAVTTGDEAHWPDDDPMHLLFPVCEHFWNGATAFANRLDMFEHVIEDKAGVTVDYTTSLVKLEKDADGKVTGVIAKNTVDNKYIRINASKGVLLACGGYPANPKMMEQLDPMGTAVTTYLNAWPTDTGDGIKAAVWSGAAMQAEPAPMLFDRGIVAPGVDAGYTVTSTGDKLFPATYGQMNIGTQPFLKVNRKGERFTNEAGTYDQMSYAAYGQPGGVYCTIFDSNWVDDVQRFHTVGCSAQTRNAPDMIKAKLEETQATGESFVADTIDELADKLGFSGDAKDTFIATVEHYNELAEAGEDTDFGKPAYRLSTIKDGPFYGFWLGAALLTTEQGILCNAKAQVRSADMEGIVENLYVCGDNAGGFFVNNYPCVIPGIAMGRNMTFAIKAVKMAFGEDE